jgi:regulator of sirC expression with transglutaminase-like and TPR domain
MPLAYPIPRALVAMLDAPAERVRLARAALLVAHAAGDPDGDPEAFLRTWLGGLDAIAQQVRERLPDGAEPADVLGALNHELFQARGFRGAGDDYYDPRMSFLDSVIEGRRGIPLSLSIVYIDVGRQLGLDLRGVAFPGHFLVKCVLPDGVVVLDPYHGGISLSLEDLQKRLREARGGEVSRAIVSELLVGATPREVILRMLRNLKGIYLEAENFPDALDVLRWIVEVAPGVPEERRDRGLVYQQLECFRAAADDFEGYVADMPHASDAQAIRLRIAEMRRAASRLN